MVISWYGEGCFKIQSSETVLTSDPFLASTGLSAPRFKSDIVIKTIAPFPPISGEEGVFGIGGAGEYNFKDITIRGFALPNESTATTSPVIVIPSNASKCNVAFWPTSTFDSL